MRRPGADYAARILGEGCVYDSDAGEEDYRKGLEWYNKAVELGDVYALVEIGICYANGWGVPQDEAKAFSTSSKRPRRTSWPGALVLELLI